MGRKILAKTNKVFFSKTLKKLDTLYILNNSIENIFSIIDGPEPTLQITQILENNIITGVTMMTMAQIRISVNPEGSNYVDKLPSYRDIKRKFIFSSIGRTLAANTGLAVSFPWIMHDPTMNGEDGVEKIVQIITDMVDNPSPNIRRIKPSQSDWQQFARGEAGAALGQIMSCPSTSFKTINIPANISIYGLEEAIRSIGINSTILEKYNISVNRIAKKMKQIYLLDNRGLPIVELNYDEPNTVHSLIQTQILGDKLCRIGLVNPKLEKGIKPPIPITRVLVEKYLNPRELIAYNFAINSGDKNILRKYTDLVRNRVKEYVNISV